ncbi:MAG: cyclic 2,3-diphosphoglycerate synthase [Candidatus Bathyarchaeota archaeon]|nr:cyclic 2,3-diphosphoglycerate synthase [Candidatus Bathyarchaeota archaeon]MDH5531939.1 cyclic 2,3-diphosphoglycerate synthase [Candidatus Bathyarchaeota archaeon]MDH5712648.1 cyclic 2,3-diphosphoglycerate synthase [Candidatus Bathyarchaeota archaeon]
MRIKVVIMGAAGRDFHNFNVCFRDNKKYEVVSFTATQIPGIEKRVYPPELAGPNYPDGIPIYPEENLPELIREHNVDQVVFAYSDVSHEYVMHRASIVLASGADFRLMSPSSTMLRAKVPVVSVCAVRTGSGKSQTSRRVCQILRKMGYKVVVVRHPMPYGDLRKQVCQRFASMDDLDKYKCTIEEREDYEPHIANGFVVYAGVDYERILREAEKEADVIVWDGGNNDVSFYVSDLYIVVADPHRPGHELTYHPGETNLRMADVVVINKVDTADPEGIEIVRKNVKTVNPDATIVKTASPVTVDNPELVRGKKVLVVEDGPTLTHGGMAYGAGTIIAKKLGASVVDPRPYAVGSIVDVFEKYSHIRGLLPAVGYGKEQIRELEETINATPCDVVVIGTPIDLRQALRLDKPAVRVRYELQDVGKPDLEDVLSSRFSKR